MHKFTISYSLLFSFSRFSYDPHTNRACYLQNIFLVGVQNKLKSLIPLRVHVVIDVFRSLPAVWSCWDEQLHIRIRSVNCNKIKTCRCQRSFSFKNPMVSQTVSYSQCFHQPQCAVVWSICSCLSMMEQPGKADIASQWFFFLFQLKAITNARTKNGKVKLFIISP